MTHPDSETLQEIVGSAFRSMLEIRLLVTVFQPQPIDVRKSLDMRVPLPAKRKGEFSTTGAIEELPALA